MCDPQTLSLPLWTVRPLHQPVRQLDGSNCEHGHAMAFSEAVHMLAFLEPRQASEWKMHHVISELGLLMLIAELHQHDVGHICLDPNLDGSGGTGFDLTDLLKRVDLDKLHLSQYP